ncbi:MAG: HDIG domain-containing protein [Spirochaetes bacterium]|nr:HDIG domain-containing protein [Spirochaetota bacterium]
MNNHAPVPTLEECYEIMRRYGMRDNIMRHSEQVMNVAMALVAHLRVPDIIQDSLVMTAALLHDIAKTRTIETKEMRHDLIGGEIMRELGYDAIAEIVDSHVVFEGFKPKGDLEARELVFYADKRVMHDTIVSIDDRVDDLVKRYGINQHIITLITENKSFVLAVEKKIQGFLTRDIEEIVAALC